MQHATVGSANERKDRQADRQTDRQTDTDSFSIDITAPQILNEPPPKHLPSTRHNRYIIILTAAMTTAAEERELLLNPVVPENVLHNTKVPIHPTP
jgi:hypothetical protein